MSDTAVRLLVVDDNDLFREGLVSLLSRYDDVDVVGQVCRGEDALRRIPLLRPDVILMDCVKPGLGGVETIRRIAAQTPDTAISMLTISEADDDLFAAVRAGARGYLLKSVDLDTLHHAILTLAAGGTVVTPHLATRLLDEFVRLAPAGRMPSGEANLLTARELEVLGLVAQGFANHEIAQQLALAKNTVKLRLRRILDKLHLRNRQQAAAFAVQEGLVQVSGDTLS